MSMSKLIVLVMTVMMITVSTVGNVAAQPITIDPSMLSHVVGSTEITDSRHCKEHKQTTCCQLECKCCVIHFFPQRMALLPATKVPGARLTINPTKMISLSLDGIRRPPKHA